MLAFPLSNCVTQARDLFNRPARSALLTFCAAISLPATSEAFATVGYLRTTITGALGATSSRSLLRQRLSQDANATPPNH
jgi:hypothetical protein